MLQNLLYSFLSTYAFIKYLIGIRQDELIKSSWMKRQIVKLLLVSLTIPTLLIEICLLLPPFLLYEAIGLYLSWRLGDNYGGLLKGQDASLEVSDEKVAITVLIVLNHNGGSADFCETIAKLQENLHESCYKLSCTIRKCCGFSYYVKDQVKKEATRMEVRVGDKDYMTKDDLMDYLQETQMHRPLNGDKMWYIKIFTQPILWSKKSDTTKQHVILLTFRHCLADGVSLIALLKHFIVQEHNAEVIKLDPKYSAKRTFSLDDTFLYRNPFSKLESNQLVIKEGSDRQLALFIEPDIKYIPIIKQIKTKLKCGFTEVLMAGLAGSISDFAIKRGKCVKSIMTAVVYRPINSDLMGIINGTYDYDKVTNDSTMVLIEVPLQMEEGSTMRDRLKAITDEIEIAKRSVDGLFLYSISKISHLWPSSTLKYITDYVTQSLYIGATNVGGLKLGTIGGHEIDTVCSYIAYYFEVGFRLSIISKENCLQLALTAKENLVYNKNELQVIMNTMFKYIDILYEEVKEIDTVH